MRFGRFLTVLICSLFIFSCSSSKKLTRNEVPLSTIRFVNALTVPNGKIFAGTMVGGLSGIDYDAKKNIYYMICDDPSAFNPARYYTARIAIGPNGIDSVIFLKVDSLRDRDGKLYPDIRKDRVHSVDLEALRYDPLRNEMAWSSEGQRVINDSTQQLQDPAIVITDINGHYKDSFALPVNMHMHDQPRGPRHNSVFEGLSFDEDGSHVYVSVEEPLYEDGPKAGTGDSTAVIRILKFNRKLKQCVAQYGYRIDPIPYPAVPAGAFKINGVSDILYLGHDKFIVIERAYSTGRIPTDIKLYLADASHAEDVTDVASLNTYAGPGLISKRLLFDMNKEIPFDIFNVEGVTLGPPLSNGHRSLVLVTDNNFNAREKTQFFLFEVIP